MASSTIELDSELIQRVPPKGKVSFEEYIEWLDEDTRAEWVDGEIVTMKGFETILALRDELTASGGHIIAPCPHERACPMADAGKPDADWRHFAARFERSSRRRRIKGAEIGYEDEKYSYIAASKFSVQPARARIIRHTTWKVTAEKQKTTQRGKGTKGQRGGVKVGVFPLFDPLSLCPFVLKKLSSLQLSKSYRHPLRRAGFTQIQLCAEEGLDNVIVTRRDKEEWKRARKAGWGDALDLALKTGS